MINLSDFLERSLIETMKFELVKFSKDAPVSVDLGSEDSCNATFDYDSKILLIEE